MVLKFMERDEKILYIAETVEQYKEQLRFKTDLYKKGERPAVLVIDMQNGFTSTESVYGAKGVSEEVRIAVDSYITSSKILLAEARSKRIPIIYTGICYREDGSDAGAVGERFPLSPKILKEGSKMVEIDERVKLQPGDYFMRKKVFSAFIGTPLVPLLVNLNVDTLVVCGNSTSGCVRCTVADAIQYGFMAVVPEECVWDRNKWTHKASLLDIMVKYADVVPLSDVIAWIKTL